MAPTRPQTKVIKKKYSQTARGLRETFHRRHETLIRKGMTLHDLCECEVLVIVKQIKTNRTFLYNSLGANSHVGPNGLSLEVLIERSYPPVIIWQADQLEALLANDRSEAMGNEDEEDTAYRLMSSSSAPNSSPRTSSPEIPPARKPFPVPPEIPMSPMDSRAKDIF